MFHKLKESYHRFIRYIKWLHMLYELNTYLSMCEPWEKAFLNCLIVVSLCFIFYSTFVFIPGHMYSLIQYFMTRTMATAVTEINTPLVKFEEINL